MPNKNPKVDAYIEKAEPFAKPILTHLRKIVHAVCPDAEETIKWGFPHFEYKGMMCNLAAHKQHCSFGFWKGDLLADKLKLLTSIGDTGMGHFGKIRSLEDLPGDDVLTLYIKDAMRLNQEGVNRPSKSKKATKNLDIPGYFLDAVRANAAAFKTFEGFSYSNKKEYLEWVTGAKTDATRDKRLATTVEWLAEGKIRNWKYVKK